MDKNGLIMIYRKDLHERYKELPIEEINLDVHCSGMLTLDEMYEASSIVFMDGNMCKILKSKDSKITIPIMEFHNSKKDKRNK